MTDLLNPDGVTSDEADPGKTATPKFDVLLSFAGAERVFARAIYAICQANGIRIFLDEEFQHEIWGKNLVEYLDDLYRSGGAYCVALLSESYRKSMYTKVERRAAFDRMLQQPDEYFLPVRIDDAWIDGLSTSTAYLDIRVQGVLGICEILVRKIRGSRKKLVVPANVQIPRVPLGQLKAEYLSRYLLELCQRQPITLFGAVVYDETSAEVRKIFSDQTYWDALDKISGPNFEVFALRDTEDHAYEVEVERTTDMITITSASRSSSRGYYFSHLLKDYFGEDKTTMAYPSLLLFMISDGLVKHSRLIPLQSGTMEECFQAFKGLFALIANTIEAWKASSTTQDVDQLWSQLKDTLLEADYTLYIQNAPARVQDAIINLQPFVEAR